MSWAQDGRERKAKELAKSETYANTGVGKPAKRKKKPIIVEVKYMDDYFATCSFLKMFHRTNEWRRHQKYKTMDDAKKAIASLTKDRNNRSEYRVKENV